MEKNMAFVKLVPKAVMSPTTKADLEKAVSTMSIAELRAEEQAAKKKFLSMISLANGRLLEIEEQVEIWQTVHLRLIEREYDLWNEAGGWKETAA